MSKLVSKLLVRSIIDPLRSLDPPVHFVCTERRTELLLDELRLQRLDLLVTDTPVALPPEQPLSCCLAEESAIHLYATPALTERYRSGFPGSLSGAPFALPLRGAALREQLQAWFNANQIRPSVVAEVEDRAMLNYLGQAGFGIIPVAVEIADEIARQFGVTYLGPAEGVWDRNYIVALEQSLRRPAVAAVFAAARARFITAASKSAAQPDQRPARVARKPSGVTKRA